MGLGKERKRACPAMLRFYNELNPPEDGSSKMPRFNLVCFGSFAIAGLIAAAVFVTVLILVVRTVVSQS